MIRKLFILSLIVAAASIAVAQPNNTDFQGVPTEWENGEAIGTGTGPLANYDYHMMGVWNGQYNENTAFEGVEWGSGEAYDANDITTIGRDMCSMGVAVFQAESGVRVDLDSRFYELHPDVVHDEAGANMRAVFTGVIGSNMPGDVQFGLRAPDGDLLQFPAGSHDITITHILGYKGTLDNPDGAVTQVEDDATECYVTHGTCNTPFVFEVWVNVPVHLPEDTFAYVPFYFCPTSPTT